MTESEAIKKLEMLNDALNENFAEADECSEAIQIGKSALEKQIQKEPIVDEYCRFTSYICPICRHEVEVSDYYCRCCGQKIRKTTNN